MITESQVADVARGLTEQGADGQAHPLELRLGFGIVRGVGSQAILSDDLTYRYALTREWDEQAEPLAVVMLNPSTADHLTDDPTIRRCVGFAKTWGFGAIHVVNLAAYRTSSPAVLRRAAQRGVDVAGPANPRTIAHMCTGRTVLCAWGSGALDLAHQVGRDVMADTLTILSDVGAAPICLGTNGSSYQPRHPLYVRGDTQPVRFP